MGEPTDTDATLDIPFDWAEWLTDKGTTCSLAPSSTNASLESRQAFRRIPRAVITPRIPQGQRIVTADGRRTSRPVYLKAVNK